jgi:aspartate/methionine/tyrosine aminotransferase
MFAPHSGQCLSVENLKDIIRLAYNEKIVLMADEVYQVRVVVESVQGGGYLEANVFELFPNANVFTHHA